MRFFKKTIFFLAFAIILLLPHVSQAVDVQSQLGAATGDAGAGYEGVPQDPRVVVANIIKITLSLLGIAFLAYTIYAGFIILTSRGEEDKINEGKQTLQRGIIGIIIILSAFSITLFAEKLATGDKKHQGNYIEIQNTDVDFSDPDQRHGTSRQGCQFGLELQPDGTCGAYEEVQ